ncbi:MAG: SRPBCC family protein [Oculatellaceae cyanobacterium Prado106]|nr:SRPBCC family protein [Oculatellaceae cyanobacterium Prado106]
MSLESEQLELESEQLEQAAALEEAAEASLEDAIAPNTPLTFNCDGVEICTEKAEGRQRQISARIQIPHPVDQVWQILTDYDHLADFIPNLAKSRKISHPKGGIRLEQVGTQSLLKFKFCARVVLDMVEQFPHQLDFQMVEGDFKKFFGSWQLQPSADGQGTDLRYVVSVLPPLAMPVGMIERRLKEGLVSNLSAIRQRADALYC